MMKPDTKSIEGKKRPRPEWKNEEDDDYLRASSEHKQVPPPLLSPHTNRLLKLIQEGTAEHAKLAAAQLSTIAAASSPTILWTLTGRLQSFLTSPDWTTRTNASNALANVAVHIPPPDQEGFLNRTFELKEDDSDNNLWLTLEDFQSNNINRENGDGLEQILSNGRILLATSESKYDEEEQQLSKLDASQQEINDFVQRRVELQRRILAQRLGLSTVVVDAIGTESCCLPDTITEDDLLLPLEDDPAARQRHHMERIKRKQQDKNEQHESKTSIRTLLVMEMRAQQHSPNNLLSHKNPQTLLATELIFRMFDANWHVRHGALLGTLAILKAWNRNNQSAFGVWPQDIMARCLCVLALDRFGDYGSAGGAGVVAPVREQAAQLLSVLWSMAPETTRTDCLGVLFRLGSYKQEWEVRHGAMLGIKYIVALLLSQQKSGRPIGHMVVETVRKVADAALIGISDNMDDVKAVAAQVLSCVFDKAENMGDIQNRIANGCCAPLMKALENVESISTSPGDLIMLFASILSYSWILVIQTVKPKACHFDTCRIKEGARILDVFARVLETSESISVKKSALDAIAEVAQSGFFDVLQPGEAPDARPMVNSLCHLLEIVFSTLFACSYSGLPGANEVEVRHKQNLKAARDQAWYQLVKNCGELLNVYSLSRNNLVLTLFRAYFGLPDQSRGISAASPGSLFGFQPRAAMALVQLLSAVVGVDQRIDYLLKMSLVGFINCPWCHLFEAACILFEKMCFMECTQMFTLTFPSVFESLRQLLVDTPRCLRAEGMPVSDEHIIQAYAIEWSTCATNCLTASGHAHLLTMDAELLAGWQAVFRRNGVIFANNADASSQGIAGIQEMRIRATTAASIVAAGREHLPEKLTPIIRPLMTSIKNESDDDRIDHISSCMKNLLEILTLEAFKGQRLSVWDKLIDKMCNLACSSASLTSSGKEATTASVAARVVGSAIGVYLLLPDSTLESLSVIWNRLEPIFSAGADGIDELSLMQSLCMLDVICSSSLGGAWPRLIGSVGPSLVLIACTSPIASGRNLATKILAFLWYSHSISALEVILPVIMKYLEERGNDAYRYGACQLLHAILDRVGSSICPCIRAVLPRAMTLMVDPRLEISREAAQCFAILVRLAPLVPKRKRPQADDDDGGSDSSTSVIDHLIHGKPLPPFVMPDALKKEAELSAIELRHYQLEGISWLEFLRSVGLNGALCDDMGVGKSVQSLIAIASCHLQASGSVSGNMPASLIVCPASLINHWCAEIRKFFPSGKVLSGRSYTSKDKGQLLDADKQTNIIVTSYAVLRRDSSKFAKKTWKYFVLDEGHLLKNPKTATAIAVRKIRSDHRLILTGTPVQNRVQELWAAFDFLMPNFLGTHRTFMKEFGRPIAKGQALNANAADIREGMDKLKLLHQQVLPFILRREKQQVLSELPPKSIMDIPCGLSSLQENIYRQFCEQSNVRESIDALQCALSDAFQRPEESKSSLGGNALDSLLYLRLLCTHPVLVKSRSWKDELVAGQLKGDYAKLDSSGKLVVLADLLRSSGIAEDALTGADNDVSALYIESTEFNLEDGYSSQLGPEDLLSEDDGAVFEVSSGMATKESPKCLIFAQFTQSLDVIEDFLFRRQMPSLRYLRLDGSVPVEKRGDLVEAFNTDESIKVMLLTTKVGGLGLNLTGASIVIFLEHDYNPHSDLQAMDRAHRIGQTQTVNVYRLVTQNTIEEKIMKLQEAKMAMSKAIVNTENSSMFSMGTDRLLDIFTFQSDKPTEANENVNESPALDTLVEWYKPDEYESLSVEEFIRSFRDDTT